MTILRRFVNREGPEPRRCFKCNEIKEAGCYHPGELKLHHAVCKECCNAEKRAQYERKKLLESESSSKRFKQHVIRTRNEWLEIWGRRNEESD